MGSWGARIYEDDVALDIRDEFLDQHISGTPATDIEQALLKENLEDDPDRDDVVYLALTCVELETGTLTPTMKEKALEIIDSGRSYQHWVRETNPEDAGLRKRELTLIKKYLESYDGKPIKRKSWVELQKADKDHRESLPYTRIDDFGWHDLEGTFPEEQIAAHMSTFLKWLYARNCFVNPGLSEAKLKKLGNLTADLSGIINDDLDEKIGSDLVAPKILPFVLAYYSSKGTNYLDDWTDVVVKNREAYSFVPTEAEVREMHAMIDTRLAQYQSGDWKQPERLNGDTHFTQTKLFIWLRYIFGAIAAIWTIYSSFKK